MREIASAEVPPPRPTRDDLPVEAMEYRLAEHYEHDDGDVIPIDDERQFDADLRQIFNRSGDSVQEEAHEFLRRHYREMVSRVSFWTSEQPSVVRSLFDTLIRRAEAMHLRAGVLEAATLIEMTAFATAVIMLYRTTHVIGRARDVRARSA
jgi:hypothetical protein